LPSESLCVAFAYAHGNGNRNSHCDANAYSYAGTEGYTHTTAPSHTGASAVALWAPNDWVIDDQDMVNSGMRWIAGRESS
jgi:hypothetical protein